MHKARYSTTNPTLNAQARKKQSACCTERIKMTFGKLRIKIMSYLLVFAKDILGIKYYPKSELRKWKTLEK